MARHGENIRKRADGRWEGRYKALDEKTGKYVYRSVYGSTYETAREKQSLARLGLTGASAEKKTAQHPTPQSCFHRRPGNGLQRSQTNGSIRPM